MAENKGTRYQVLREENGAWREVAQVDAAQAEAAIKDVAGENEGVYRAVPVRNWGDPVEVETEQRTVVRLRPRGGQQQASLPSPDPEPGHGPIAA